MEGAGEAKSDGPWVRVVFGDFGKIVSGLFDGLAAGKEDDASKVGRDVLFKNLSSGLANFGWSGLLVVLFAGEDHVGFENASA